MEKSRSLHNCNNFSLSRVETENFIEVVAVVVAAVLLLLLSSKQAAKLDTPAQAAIKQKARSCSSSSSTGSKRQQHARQQHAVQRRQQQQQHSNNNTATSTTTTAACGVPRQQHTRLLAYVVNCTIPRQHSAATHTPLHIHICVTAKSFLIKLNLMLPNAQARLSWFRFGFILHCKLHYRRRC